MVNINTKNYSVSNTERFGAVPHFILCLTVVLASSPFNSTSF